MPSNDTANSPRIFFWDNLRTFIILLVIIFHVAIGYMSPPIEWWYVNDVKSSLFFTILVMTVDVFIMPVMFLIAGYFTMPALHRNGFRAFFANKATRIALPWLAGVLLFAPAITYMIWFSRSATPPAYLAYWQTTFFSPTVFNHAHYWFLGILCYFYLIATGLQRFAPHLLQVKASPTRPSPVFFISFAFITTAAFFIPNLFFPADAWFSKFYVISFQPTRLPLYFAYFLLGLYAQQASWFRSGGYFPPLRRWLIAALVSLVLFTLYRLTFPVPPGLPLKAVHAALHAIFCLSMVFALLAVFYHKVQSSAYLWRKLSTSSYTIYYIHQFIVLPIAYALQKLDFPVAAKYLFSATLCLLLCYGAAQMIQAIRSQYAGNQR